MIGRYPTPVERLPSLCRPGCDLWVKRDDLTAERYGGNKVRKLDHLVPHAIARGARRIVTIGAAGSHHVLATTLYARAAGLGVAAVLVPQPRTDHAVDVLRAALGAGLEAHAARTFAGVGPALVRTVGRGDWVVPPGGSNVVGTRGYVDGARELGAQIRAGALPEPDAIVVALGSGGTSAGIAAGLVLEGIGSEVVAVRVTDRAVAGRWRTLGLARAAAGRPVGGATFFRLASRFTVDPRWLGAGYGHATAEGTRATEVARDAGIVLDPTYTAKTFAAALDRVASGRCRNVLYWHTLSSAPMEPLLRGAPAAADLPPGLAGLFE